MIKVRKSSIRTERGLALFELIVVLSFGALVFAGVAHWWSRSERVIRIEETVTQIVDLAGFINKSWGPRGSYAGLSEAALAGAPSLPKGLVVGGQIEFEVTRDTVDNVDIAPFTSAGVGCNGRANCNNSFYIGISRLDPYECQILARRTYGENYYGLSLGPIGSGLTANVSPTDMATINAVCNQGAANGYQIVLYFM